MKKLLLLIAFISASLSGFAQFEEGKYYTGASVTGFNLSYNGTEKLNIGLEAKGGYLFSDNWMATAQAGFNHSGAEGVADTYFVGVGARYYIVQNGLFMGLNAKLIHANHSYNDLMPELEVGYAFFVNDCVTIEPAIYYDQSFKNHSDYSKIGLRIGIGVYL